MIDKETKSVKYPIIIQPRFKKPKVDRYIEIKLEEKYFRLTIKNPFYR